MQNTENIPYGFDTFLTGQKFAMLEEKVVLSSVLRKLRLQSIDKREDIPLLSQLTLRPQNGIRIKISPR
jgi:cytochrome P450